VQIIDDVMYLQRFEKLQEVLVHGRRDQQIRRGPCVISVELYFGKWGLERPPFSYSDTHSNSSHVNDDNHDPERWWWGRWGRRWIAVADQLHSDV
jgi:hypothetical protein